MTTIFEISDTLVHADNKALATYGPLGINVVPVSTLYTTPAGEIVLVNYFLQKTLQNILEHPEIAITCWSGMAGYQVKGEVVYMTEGEKFEDIKNKVYQILPERVVKGILVLTPREIHDISPRT